MQRRRAVGAAVLRVQLVTHFLDDHIVTGEGLCQIRFHLLPCQDDWTARPRLAVEGPLMGRVHPGIRVGRVAFYPKGARIEGQFDPARVAVDAEPEDRQAGEHGDNGTDFLCGVEAVAVGHRRLKAETGNAR